MSLETEIAAVIRQEDALKFKSFNEADAWKLGQQMHHAATKAGHPFLIEIRLGGRQLFVSALAGTSADNSEWVRRKANSVMRFHKSSYRVGSELAGSLENSGHSVATTSASASLAASSIVRTSCSFGGKFDAAVLTAGSNAQTS